MSQLSKLRTPSVVASAFVLVLLVTSFLLAKEGPDWMWGSIDGLFSRLEVLAKVATPLAILVGLYIAWRRSTAHELQAKTAEQGQITDRFTKAVEQLADKERLAVRLGGIYALERIAADSHDRDHRVVFEVLCAFVREKRTAQKDGENLGELPQDVQAVLSVIRRRERIPEEEILDFHKADLRKATLHQAHLEGANLHGAYLHGAILVAAHLESADLVAAHLEGANLRKAHLEGAKLVVAHLEGANLYAAHLERADLGAAHLENARLGKAHLEGAILIDAQLEGANLESATGLTAAQLASAHGNAETWLPKGFSRPDSWLEAASEPQPSEAEA